MSGRIKVIEVDTVDELRNALAEIVDALDLNGEQQADPHDAEHCPWCRMLLAERRLESLSEEHLYQSSLMWSILRKLGGSVTLSHDELAYPKGMPSIGAQRTSEGLTITGALQEATLQ